MHVRECYISQVHSEMSVHTMIKMPNPAKGLTRGMRNGVKQEGSRVYGGSHGGHIVAGSSSRYSTEIFHNKKCENRQALQALLKGMNLTPLSLASQISL